MKRLQSKMLLGISIVLSLCIVVVIILILFGGNKEITVNYFVPGNLNNIGCLSVYVENADDDSEYSFDNGKTWQKNSYGAIYEKTTILVRDKNKEIIYQEDSEQEGFVSDAPVIKMNFDETYGGRADSELLKGVKASINGKDVTSNIKTNIIKEEDGEILVSYLVHSDIKRCYIVRKSKLTGNNNTNPGNNSSGNGNVKEKDEWLWPTKKPYKISSNYGWRNKKFHSGVDITGTGRGSPIYAARAGVVTDVTSNSSSGYYVTIKHDDGYYTRYAHMQNTKGTDKLGLTSSASKYVFVGLRVKGHDVIGEMGSSGNSTGPHLHFEIWNGKPYVSKSFNPLDFYKK